MPQAVVQEAVSAPSTQAEVEAVYSEPPRPAAATDSSPASALEPEYDLPPAKIVLSDEQQKVHDLVVDGGESIFFTGSAGTGKSVLLRKIIDSLREKYHNEPQAVAVTASTGLAGCNIGGGTVHAFAGIGLGTQSAANYIEFLSAKRSQLKKRWRNTRVWVIDEISMLDGPLFDKLAAIASGMRQNHRPFGGIQMIVCGDFFQLPPVDKERQDVSFAFESEIWPRAIQRQISLTTVFRQRDQQFIDVLNELRMGTVSEDTVDLLNGLAGEVVYEDGIEPTALFPLRWQVEDYNAQRMQAIPGKSVIYKATDKGMLKVEQRDKTLSHLLALKMLELKVGVQVMLIKAIPQHLLFNGSVGIVQGFDDDLPVVNFVDMHGRQTVIAVEPATFAVTGLYGEEIASRMQIPLVPAWAMSIHKSQGQTLERVKVDLEHTFDSGQAYVALSRATSLDTLQVTGFRPDIVRCHPRVKQWSETALMTI